MGGGRCGGVKTSQPTEAHPGCPQELSNSPSGSFKPAESLPASRVVERQIGISTREIKLLTFFLLRNQSYRSALSTTPSPTALLHDTNERKLLNCVSPFSVITKYSTNWKNIIIKQTKWLRVFFADENTIAERRAINKLDLIAGGGGKASLCLIGGSSPTPIKY